MAEPLAARLGRAQIVAITGPDARRFAAGLFTNDVQRLAVGGVQRQACCDARGRLQGLFDLVSLGEDRFLAVLEGRDADEFAAWYDRYVLMDEVEVAAVPGERTVVTVQGDGAAARLAAAGLPTPDGVAEAGEVLVFRRDRAGLAGFDVVTADPDALGPFDEAGFEAARVAAGDVRWPDDMSDKQLVHELGLRDAVLCFTKGCYIGQETINRLDVRGGIKQRLVAVKLSGPAASGTEVVVGDKAVGVLRSVVEHPDHGWIGLSVVRMPHDAPGTALRVGEMQGETADLPL